MIYNSGNIYAKVWKVMPSENGKYADLQITTSEKDKDGQYTNSTWFGRILGHSLNSLKDVKEGDRILITKSKFTNIRKKMDDDTYKTFFKFLILEAKTIDNKTITETKTSTKTADAESSIKTDDGCPW